jgi:hypothetical protein
MWEFLHGDRWTMPETVARGYRDHVVPHRRTPQHEEMLPQIAEAGSGVDLGSPAPHGAVPGEREA